MVATAAKLRPTFDDCLEPAEAPEAIRLSEGSQRPAVICVSSLLAIAGPHQYARFAKPFRGLREMSALPVAGFLVGERLPASFQAAVETHAASVRRAAGDAPVVLLGHSTGGILAHALAEHLERTGTPPAAVVLVDTHWGERLAMVGPAAIGGMLARNGAHVAIADAALTAMAAYSGFVIEREPLDARPGAAAARVGAAARRRGRAGGVGASLDVPHTAVDVAGDHFTGPMEAHQAEATARAAQQAAERGPEPVRARTSALFPAGLLPAPARGPLLGEGAHPLAQAAAASEAQRSSISSASTSSGSCAPARNTRQSHACSRSGRGARCRLAPAASASAAASPAPPLEQGRLTSPQLQRNGGVDVAADQEQLAGPAAPIASRKRRRPVCE